MSNEDWERKQGRSRDCRGTYHELLFNLAQAVETRLKLEVVVRSCLGNGGNDSDPVTLGADVVGG
jgi:hypothetical protein